MKRDVKEETDHFWRDLKINIDSLNFFYTILYEIYLPEYPGTRLEFLRASNCAELDKEL